MFKVPVCYRFCPRERELVDFFLIPKAKGLALPEGHQILERTLYGDEAAPWKVFKDDDPWEWFDDNMKQKIIYVITRVIAKNGQGRNRTVRWVGCGTWDGKSVRKPIKGLDGSVVAYKRGFKFKPKKEYENEMRGKWIMHEYSLANAKDYKDGDVVVCRISHHVEKEGSRNEDERSGLDSDAESNSVKETSKRKGNKRVMGGGVSTDKSGNQEGGQIVGENALGQSLNLFGIQMLNNQEFVVPCRTASEQQNEDQEIVQVPVATPQYPDVSDKNESSTPILYEFFK